MMFNQEPEDNGIRQLQVAASKSWRSPWLMADVLRKTTCKVAEILGAHQLVRKL